MADIDRLIKRTHDSGSWSYATVESIGLNKATVRLKPAGTRLTNLPISGGRIKVGDTVVVDYASGKPVVRPLTNNVYDNSDGMFGFTSPGFSGFPARPQAPTQPSLESPIPEGNPTDIGCSVWAYEYSNMDPGTEYDLQYREAIWDTNDFYDPLDDTNLLVKIPGLYIIIARIGFATNTIEDTKYRTWAMVGSTKQAEVTAQTIWGTGAIGKIYEMSGTLICEANDLVKVKVSQDNSFKYHSGAQQVSMSSDGTNKTYPHVQLQWLGVVE